MLRDHFSVYGGVLLWKKSNYNVHLSNFVSKYLITLQSQTPRKMHFSEMNFHKRGLVINVCLVIFEMHIFPVYFQLKIHTHLVCVLGSRMVYMLLTHNNIQCLCGNQGACKPAQQCGSLLKFLDNSGAVWLRRTRCIMLSSVFYF